MDNEKSSHSLLSDQQKRVFSEFKALLTLWEGAYPYVLFSYVGIKNKQGPILLSGRLTLLPSLAGINTADFRLETEYILAARAVAKTTVPIIASILENAKAGEIRDINSGLLLTLKGDGHLSADFYPDHHPFLPEGPAKVPCIQVRGISPFNLIMGETGHRTLDGELKAADLPFDGLDELLTYCNLPTQAQIRDFTLLEIIASPPGLISNRSTILGGEARIECQAAASLDAEKIKVGCKIYQKDSIERTHVGGDYFQWRQEGDIKIGIYQLPVKDAPLLQAFLSYGGILLHYWFVMDPQKGLNYRHVIHQILDEKLEQLREMLFMSGQHRSDYFEFAVSMLFSLLGFSTMKYGRRMKLMEGPDIIAITPAGNIGVIECTVGLPNHKSKLAKVAEKTLSIRDRLIAAGFSHLQVQPVVVTPLTREAVSANRQDAAKLGIALICKEDIEELLKRVVLPSNPERLFDEAKQLIPVVDE